MNTDRNDPSYHLSHLSELSAKQTDPIKKTNLLLEYLEAYVDKGGTLRTWAFEHFKQLCRTMESLQDSQTKAYASRVDRVIDDLQEILEIPDLRKELHRSDVMDVTLQSIGEIPSLESRLAVLNHLVLKIDLYFATNAAITSTFLQNLRADLSMLGFTCGQLKMGTIHFSWNGSKSGSGIEYFPAIGAIELGYSQQDKLNYFPPSKLKQAAVSRKGSIGLVLFVSKDNLFTFHLLIEEVVWTRSEYEHLMGVISKKLWKRCKQEIIAE